MRHPRIASCSVLALLAGCAGRAAEPAHALSTPDPGHSQLTALRSFCEDPAPDGPGVIFASPYTTGRSALYKRNFQSPAPILLADADADLRMPAPSPDGRTLAFVSNTRGKWDLFQVSLPQTDVARWTLVAGSAEDQATPSWSPDGAQLAWSSLDRRDGIWRVRIRARDGSVREVGEGLAPAWHPDGTRLVCQRARAGSGVWSLVVVDLATGASRDLLPSPEAGGITPAWTRDGRWVLYARVVPRADGTEPEPGDIWAVSADGAEHARLTATAAPKWCPREVEGGRFVYCRRHGETVDLWMAPLRLP